MDQVMQDLSFDDATNVAASAAVADTTNAPLKLLPGISSIFPQTISPNGFPCIPSLILFSDQGGYFTSKLMQDICEVLKICKVKMTAYH
uniref:Integrase catalytic domain-containing protein n=1 Tax=Romanomermis culicivorax TaxID=13658 RepID=A0A915I424_ROMCU